MEHEARRAARTAYKERKVEAGIYAVRCAASGQVWAGSAPDVSTIRNRLWFTLQWGNNGHATLQAAWNRHGEAAFSFEIVERIEPAESAWLRSRTLRDRLAHWLDRLGATRI